MYPTTNYTHATITIKRTRSMAAARKNPKIPRRPCVSGPRPAGRCGGSAAAGPGQRGASARPTHIGSSPRTYACRPSVAVGVARGREAVAATAHSLSLVSSHHRPLAAGSRHGSRTRAYVSPDTAARDRSITPRSTRAPTLGAFATRSTRLTESQDWQEYGPRHLSSQELATVARSFLGSPALSQTPTPLQSRRALQLVYE